MRMGDRTETRLYRSRTDRVWKGVCGGLAHALGLDPLVVRLVVVALAWVTHVWPVLLAYVLAAHVLPSRSASQEATDTGPARPISTSIVGWGAIILGGALLLQRISSWVDTSLVLAVAAIAIGINLVVRHRADS